MADPLVGVLVVLAAAAFMGEIFWYFRVPRVVGQIAAGVIVGVPVVRSFVLDAQGLTLISYLADIGVILLLFFTGLEINFRTFAQSIRITSGISLWKTTLPLAGGYLVSRYIFGLNAPVSLIVGIGLSVSAIALALDLLEEFNMLKTKFGALVVSAGAVDDVYGLGLITLAVAFIGTVAAKAAVMTLVWHALLFATAVVIFRVVVVPFILRFVERGTEITLLMSGIIITLLMAALSSYLGFGSLIGALASGIIVRQTLLADVTHHRPWEAGHITKGIHLVAFGFFVPIFFVHAGLLTDLTAIWQNLGFGVVITLIAIVGTVVGSAIAYYLSRKNWREGFLLGWALNARGDTELVIATLALGAGVISQSIFSSLIFMAMVSTLISPIVFRYMLEWRKKTLRA